MNKGKLQALIFCTVVFLVSVSLGYSTYALNGGFVNQGETILVEICAIFAVNSVIGFALVAADII